MKARVFTAQQTRLMAKAAKDAAGLEIENAAVRAQGLWCAAALDAGYKPCTVNRVLAHLPDVLERYGAYKQDGMADFALWQDLKKNGIDFGMPTSEI